MAAAPANARVDAAGADEAAGGDAVEHDAVEHEGAVAAGVACAAGGGGQGLRGSLSRGTALGSFESGPRQDLESQEPPRSLPKVLLSCSRALRAQKSPELQSNSVQAQIAISQAGYYRR